MVLRAFKTIAMADGVFEARQRSFVETHQRALAPDVDIDAIPTIRAEEVAATISDPTLRKAIVQRMVIIALLDELADNMEVETLQAFSQTLGVDEPAVGQTKLVAKGSVKGLAFDMLRHGFLARVFRNEWNARGLGGILRGVRAMSGGRDAKVASRFQALRKLPTGTLGARYIAYMDANKFPLPGEPKGAAEMLIFHDLGHALTGYLTDVPGEMRMAGLEAGYMKEDGFGVIALALFGFHLGIPLPNISACRGGFDWSAVEEGYRRGRTLNVDLRGWDPWPYMDQPVEKVREALGAGA